MAPLKAPPSPLFYLLSILLPSSNLSMLTGPTTDLMYVDDGTIFSTTPTYQSSSQNATLRLQEITTWLGRNGLQCDKDKTKFITFAPSRPHHLIGNPVMSIQPYTSASSSYTVECSSLIQYLGVFIHKCFDWSHHVTIMANHTCSTVHALSILGNTVWGLNYANWRRIFHSLILPVLTYGFPLYSTQPCIKGLLDILQVAQNDAVRQMSSAFKTTPVIPLHYLLAIPPLPLTIIKLTDVFRLCIQHLPPSHLIRTITTFNPTADWHLSLQPPTCLTRLLPDSFPPFIYPSPTYKSMWTHPQVWDNTIFKISPATKEATKHLIKQPSYDTFHLFVQLLTIPSPPFAASFLLFKGQTLVHSGVARDSSRVRTLFLALCQGLTYASLSNHVCIFLLDLSLQPYLFCSHKHPLLDLSHAFLSLLSSFLSADPVHHIDIFRYSIKWSGLLGTAIVDTLSEEQQQIIFPDPPPSLLLPKAHLLHLFQEQFDLLRQDSRIWQSII